MVFESTYERPKAAMNITSDQEGYNINYTISEILLAFRLLAIYDLLADGRINDGTVNFFTSSLLKKKIKRFYVAVRLFSSGSQITSKRGRNTRTNSPYDSCATFLFLAPFDVICGLLLNRRTATWILHVTYFIDDVSKASLQSHYHVISLNNELRLLTLRKMK